MPDLYRWLRYSIPGALAELVVGLWLYIKWLAEQEPTSVVPTGHDTIVAAVVVASTLPLGFALSIVAHFLIWFPERLCVVPLARIDNRGVLEGAGKRAPRNDIEAAARVDVLLHQSKDEPSRARALALVGMGISLATTFVGVVTGWIIVLALCIRGDFEVAPGWASVYLLVTGVFAAVVWCGQQRVTKLTTQYLRELLKPQ